LGEEGLIEGLKLLPSLGLNSLSSFGGFRKY